MSASDATAYPYTVLSRLHEVGAKPNRQKILRTTQELTANAASVDSVYGDHGHAFLTMSPASYQVLNGGQAFAMPAQPDQNPTIVVGATAAVIAETVRQHKASQEAYRLMRRVQANLRKMLLESSDEIYWRLLRQDLILYSGRTVRELLNHMNTTYGAFTEAERRDVASRMDVPWEGGPLEAVIQQIQEGSDAFGIGGAALNDTQKRDRIYDLINSSNLMPEACQRWRMTPVADKTWNNACTHFQQFANDRDEVQTAGGAGFVANHVEMTLAANADALDQLSSQMANLGVTNTSQAATILDLTTRLAAANATHQAYRDYRPRNNNGRDNGREPRNPGNGDEGPREPQPRQYCWSHGYCAHNGNNCNRRRTGHQASATLSNRMSGSNSNCP
jgi:hypothetical protein